MESVILPCKSIPHISIPTLSEYSPKPTISFVSDTQLNHLCTKNRLNEAIVLLDAIPYRASTVTPNTFARLIQSCIDSNSITLGRKLHARLDLLKKIDPFVETKFVSMYAKLGYLDDAREVFDKMPERNLFAWSAMVGACSREKRWNEVVRLFCEMMKNGVLPDGFLFPKILQACGNCGDIEVGRMIHSIVVRFGVMGFDTRVHNAILAVYAKCGELESARRFFEKMEGKDRVSWNSVITGYCQKGNVEEATRLFGLMRKEGVEPGLVTWNIIISSYNQLGFCDVAFEMMREMETLGITPDVFTWTSMISGFSQNNRRTQALEFFSEMVLQGVMPNGVTLTSAISACALIKSLKKGKELHCFAVKNGFVEMVLVGNSLVDVYSKCGELIYARMVFDLVLEKDVYTWNSMIGGYCQAGYCGEAHDLFIKMQESDVKPNVITWNVMITGCIQNGAEDQAMNLFHKMEEDGTIKRDTASWNSLIAGYIQNGNKNKALEVFREMQSLNVKPNSVTVLSILPACANLVSEKKVREIHGCVLRRNLESELSVVNSIIDTYSKSGNIVYSKAIFNGTSVKDIITWNTLITGFVLHGFPFDAIDLFDQMRKQGFEPNRGTFVSIISAYSLAKMVEDGKRAFSSMIEEYRIVPYLDHCAAMVDLYGRSGRFEEATEFIENMSLKSDSSVWSALLTACRIHGNVGLAVLAGERLLELEPDNISMKRMVLELNELCGISKESLKVKKSGRSENKESLGQSWIEVKNTVHTFVSGDRCQTNAENLCSWIKGIREKIKGSNSPNGLSVEEEDNEEGGGFHSEKLAFAFSITDSRQASRNIRIVKNMRMCGDCHRTAKYISKAYGSAIYVNDSKCLHHFKDGRCSCGDYW